MRLFVAIGAHDINFDPTVVLKKLRINLDKKEIEYRWVPQENYHITLNFLGETPQEKLEPLKLKLEELSGRHEIFHLKIHGVGAFPSVREGRVIWMDVQNSLELRSLQEDCEKQLLALGFKVEERPFTPHLTIARLRNARRLSDSISPLLNQNFGEMAVKMVTLYQSKAGGAFPVYEPLFKFPLRERAAH